MALLHRDHSINSYFSSVSTLNKKLVEESKDLTNGHGWEGLSIKDKESLFNRLFIPQCDESGYGDIDVKDEGSQFPDLKVKCGEKIVVDFENEDGWTWTDEHSGPFSWMTKSQQNLTLEEIYQDDIVAREKKDQPKCRPPSYNEFPSAAKNTGMEEQLFSNSSNNQMSEIQAAFHKFGIKVPDEKDIAEALNSEADFNLDVSFEEFSSDELTANTKEEGMNDIDCPQSQIVTDSSFSGCSELSSSPEQTLQTKHSKRTLNTLLKWPWGKKKHEKKSQSASTKTTYVADTTNKSVNNDAFGHVSPVFEMDDITQVITSQPKLAKETYDNVDEYGRPSLTHSSEYSTPQVPSDYMMTTNGDMNNGTTTQTQNIAEVGYAEEDTLDEKVNEKTPSLYKQGNIEENGVFIDPVGESTDLPATMESEHSIEHEDSSHSLTAKTGFDFLDNW